MRTILVTLALGATFAMGGCSGTPSERLTGTSWQLAGLAQQDPTYRGVVPAAGQALYTLTFEADGRYTGTAACNQFSGSYTTSGSDGVTISPGPSTLAYCGDDSYGALYVNALGRGTTYSIDGDELTLSFESGGGLQFDRVASGSQTGPPATEGGSLAPLPQGSDSVLAGRPWQLVTIKQEQPPYENVVPADAQPIYTIEFGTDGTASVQADCNALAGTYTTADPSAASGNLRLVGGASTLAACPEGSLADVYLSALADVDAYAVADDELALTGPNGVTLVYQAGVGR